MSGDEIRRLMPDVRLPEPRPHSTDQLEIEQQTYLRDTLLRDTDVLGMAHGVEIRPPYLDPAVLKVASSIGSDRLTRLDRPSKWVLRDGWTNVLEPRTLRRPKTGFTLDFRSCLAKSEGVLHEAAGRVRRSSLFDAKALAEWLSQSRRLLRTTHPSSSVHTLMMLHVWNQLERWGEP
jgi:asparagine synthase (glutamine-hydrolysing)